MDWKKLLSEKRVRELSHGAQSVRDDSRTEFERDYDRAIFSTPVRRLHDKAQVFPLEPNDSVRTRLTHSLEVSTVSRDVARTIGRWLVEKNEADERQGAAIETIAATCGLIHDLGNPPFGHAGEEAIREWFRSRADDFFDWAADGSIATDQSKHAKDFLLFEGNAQTLRLVSKLQVLADLHGLNFTCGTVSAACKYIARSDEVSKSHHETSKVGYFVSEEDLIEQVREETGTGKVRNPITFLVEACDDAVYSVVDLEDGIKKRVITWPQLQDCLVQYSDGDRVLLDECFAQAEKMLAKGKELDPSIQTDDEAMSVAFRVYAINHLVKAMVDTFKDKYDAIMAGEYHGELISNYLKRVVLADNHL
jgi:dGTPase